MRAPTRLLAIVWVITVTAAGAAATAAAAAPADDRGGDRADAVLRRVSRAISGLDESPSIEPLNVPTPSAAAAAGVRAADGWSDAAVRVAKIAAEMGARAPRLAADVQGLAKGLHEVALCVPTAFLSAAANAGPGASLVDVSYETACTGEPGELIVPRFPPWNAFRQALTKLGLWDPNYQPVCFPGGRLHRDRQVDCASPHRYEVFALVEPPLSTRARYPSKAYWAEFIARECARQLANLSLVTGVRGARASDGSPPTTADWADGLRSARCVAGTRAATTSGSIREGSSAR